jgi:hypothetical protein
VPQGIVQLKEDEFRELTQGGRTVSEYVHKFTELACYALDDVSTEAKKMARFLKGLRPELKTILANQDFLSSRTSQTKPYKWKGQGKKKRSPQEEIPSPLSSAARPAPENSILWVSTQGTKLQ